MPAPGSTYDAIVVGVGGMGSATLYHLTRRGAKRVLGLEQFDIPTDRGSSHGLSGIIRFAHGDRRNTRVSDILRWPHVMHDGASLRTQPSRRPMSGDSA